MKTYILTGKYGNGDEYGERLDSLGMVAFTIGSITQFDHDGTPPENRILSDSIIIETEDE